ATGDKKYYDERARVEVEVHTIYANKEEFQRLKKWKESGTIVDSLLLRQLTILHNSYLGSQIDSALMRKIVEKGADIARMFNTHRGLIDGKEVTDNDISQILKNEKDSGKRKKAWEAGKQVGQSVAPLVVELVKLRNEAAHQLGYPNYYEMALALGEQDPKEILSIFDELKNETDAPFRRLKGEVDAALAARYSIKPGEMYPWHYEDPFFQEAPEVGSDELNKCFEGKEIQQLAEDFYKGIGLPVDELLKKSDLYPLEKKYQHAFCTDIDRMGDVRIMTNIVPDGYWMSTVLHELGHASYSKNVDKTLPYFLRSEAHTFTTEAIAIMMERQAKNADWLEAYAGVNKEDKEKIRKTAYANLRLQQLIFSRWSQVMMRFEKSMYAQPDQDLNKLWWDLVEEFQFVKRPPQRNQPDWAAKIHIAQYPVYYHNYMLGSLMASQVAHAIMREALKIPESREVCFAGKPEVGTFLKEKIFQPGARFRWDEMIRRATGENLTAKYFARDFVED
ncbi:MAG: M2 family metallopeptidase, partial [Ignavibacteriales bacterium]|nr:M2 family metallopeptidase [Ignavibacteriales bacterium]